MPPTSAFTCGKPGIVTVYNRPPMRSLYSNSATRAVDFRLLEPPRAVRARDAATHHRNIEVHAHPPPV